MSDLAPRLQALAQTPEAPPKTQNHARALHDRLLTPLQIMISGPDAALAGQLVQALPADAVGFQLTDDFAQADIVVWCSHDFAAEEVAFWEDAPAHLQDHSHLVSYTDTNMQSVGGAYFRNCWAVRSSADTDSLVAVVMRQIRLGKQADEDQAHVLLARFPNVRAAENPAPTTVPASPNGTLAEYLQEQANQLAALDISDTQDSCAAVLERCADAIDHLTTLVQDVPDLPVQEMVFEASDAITLMVIEGDISAATDAVTVLLQLQKEMRQQTCLTV